MSFRKEEKLKIPLNNIFLLKKMIIDNEGKILYPPRKINSIYFDNQNFSMYNHSIEGIVPRKKIRIRIYNQEFKSCKDVKKEIKITAVEGRYKTSENIRDFSQVMNLGILDRNYGVCIPVLNVTYKRSYYLLENIRITFDENIYYKKITNKQVSKFSTFDNYCIVELKYNSDKFINFCNTFFPFQRIRFSKYCRGIEFTELNYCNDLDSFR
jgi:SPX domain protein involved in polyphosphate accumulation